LKAYIGEGLRRDEAQFTFSKEARLIAALKKHGVKRKLKNSPPESNERLHVTSAGFVFYGLIVFALFAGITQEHLAPDTEFGRFVSTRLGRLMFVMAIAVISAAVGTALEKMGIKFVVRKSSGDL
jgi:hypothetical protein